MNVCCRRSELRGSVRIPGSKSHTIRAVAGAAMAAGESVIEAPLVSADTAAAVRAARAMGAQVREEDGIWRVRGCGGQPRVPDSVIDVGNSGTTLRIMMGLATLLPEGRYATFTGDEQIRRRPAGPLVDALNALGADVRCLQTPGCAPFRIGGHLQGGEVTVQAPTSQYVTSLLMAAPLAPRETQIHVALLREAPYVQITLDWLAWQGIQLERDGYTHFRIPGGQTYTPFQRAVPADFSSAAFFLCAGALPGNSVTCVGLDLRDSQPDKQVLDYLRDMGAHVVCDGDSVSVSPGPLRGRHFDLDATPDALPVMAVTACFARGTTVLGNVPHARIKETDRIACMCRELRHMGADIEELPDGLVIRESTLRGAPVDGCGDHRIVMALALAGLAAPGETTVSTAEAVAVTFPTFPDLMRQLGANLASADDA